MNDPQAVFTALADPTRRAVFERLSGEGPASASQLASELPITRQAISKHLAVLDDAGLVTRSSVGREIQYSAEPAALTDVTVWATRIDARWKRRLEKLQSQFKGRS